MEHEVLGVDIDPEVVQKISPFITHAIVADTTDEEAIKALALSQFEYGYCGYRWKSSS